MTCANPYGCERDPRPRGRYCGRCAGRKRKGLTLDLRVPLLRAYGPNPIPGLYGRSTPCPMCGRMVVESALYDPEDGGKPVCVRCAILIHEREQVLA